jgi:hypothetical protein
VHNHFWCEPKENMLEKSQSKSEACPIVSIFQNLQAVPINVDLAIKELGIECLIGNFAVSTVLGFVLGVLKCKVMLNWATW